MSLEIQAKLICDGCGKFHKSAVGHGVTNAKAVAWRVRFRAEQVGWKTINRGRGHTQTHYCPECLDKPMKPVPRKKANRGA